MIIFIKTNTLKKIFIYNVFLCCNNTIIDLDSIDITLFPPPYLPHRWCSNSTNLSMRLYLICKGPPDEYGQFGAVQHGASVSPSYHSLSTRAHSTRIVFGTWSCSVVGGGLTPPTPEEPATAEAAADAGYGVAPSCGESEISI